MLTETIREAIIATRKPIYQISKETGIAQPILSRFMNYKRGMTLETVEKLFNYLNLDVINRLVIRRMELEKEMLEEKQKFHEMVHKRAAKQ